MADTPSRPDDARALQDDLAARVESRDRFPSPLRTLAAFAVRPNFDGTATRAGVVMIDIASGDVLARVAADADAAGPPVDGMMSFHLLPALLAALDRLPDLPDLAMVSGHGIAHPKGLGAAAHFGVAAGLATVGVAGDILTGTGPEPHQVRGAYTPLRHGRRQIGWLLRSKPGEPPLVVSPGHRVAMASAADLVMRFVGDDRLPEPMRLAMAAAG